jgi:hypothetical protein
MIWERDLIPRVFLQLKPRSPGPPGSGASMFHRQAFVHSLTQKTAGKTWMAGTKPGHDGK